MSKKISNFLFLFIIWVCCYFVRSQSVNFSYTGNIQTYIVPVGVTNIDVTVAGAKGGGANGGYGAIITKYCYSVTPGQTLEIRVGGMGNCPSAGWNGGGAGTTASGAGNQSCGGGGSSDIRVSPFAAANRIVVAAGGGGMGGGNTDAIGGNGGCVTGTSGTSPFGQGGYGATQLAGGNGGPPWILNGNYGQAGALLNGGNGASDPCYNLGPGGGGGGGLYGGGGGGSDCYGSGSLGGGGGGSGSSLVPTGGTCVSGGNGGNGYVIITPSQIPGVTASNTGPYCPGQTIELNATGGGTYAWSGPNGFTSSLQNPTIPNMTAANTGTYTVTVSNSGCSVSTTTTVTLNTGAIVNLVPTNAACASATNGSINVTATGSTPGYNVSWTGPSSGNPAGIEIANSGGNYNIANLGIGTYTVTVTANNLCATTATTTIYANPGVTGSATTFAPPLCNGSSDGSITVTANQGIPPYQVSWTGPSSGNPAGDEISSANGNFQITSASAGSYNITITDAVGCTYSFPFILTQPISLSASLASTPVLCNGGATGTLTGNATGGTAPYNMSWAGPINGDPLGNEIITSGGSYTVNNLPQGFYTITIIDANGCLTTSNTQVNQPQPLLASAVNSSALCNGSADGTITVTASDGTAPYNVSWTGASTGNPAGYEIIASNGTYQITLANAGNYTITVTDANGCATQTTSIVTEPLALNASATNTPALCNGSADGTITVTSNDGTPAYNVSWAGPISGNPIGNEITATGGNYTITGVSAGTYTITVTDANGCTTTTTSTITEPTSVTASATNTAVLCNGGSTGTITGIASGGTAPYNMSWVGPNTGDPAGDEIITDGGSYTVNGAPAGTYTITLTDDNGCVATTTTQIIEPAGLTASALNSAVLCNGGFSGSVQGTATGGIAPYNMSWAGPINGDPLGNEIITSGGSYTVNGASAGFYSITITDGNGCTATTSTNVIEPDTLQINTNSTPPLCNGLFNGFINITALGGIAPYEVSWTGPINDNPAGYEITNDGGSYTITGVGAGTYTVTLIDANGCATNTTVTLVPPVALSIETQTTNVLCNGGNDGLIQVTATNGSAGYNVSWAGTATGNPAGIEINSSGGNFSITNLNSGSYTVFVIDNNGCIDSNTVQLTEPILLSSSDLITNPLCQSAQDGSITITAVGGVPGYNVSLTGTLSSNPAGIEIANNGESYTFSNLGTGNYTLTISDQNACQLTYPFQLTASNAPPTVTVQSDTLCYGQSTQLLALASPSGGTFLWNNNVQSNTITVQPNVTTSYSVLYNYNGCLAQATASVVVYPIPTVSLSNASTCEGGSVTLTPTMLQPSGGSFLWSTNSSNPSLTVSPQVTSNFTLIYSVNGCSSLPVTATVVVNPIPQVSVQDVSICEGETAILNATSNLPGGTYLWTPNLLTTPSISVAPLITTSYSLVYSLNGCSSVSENAQVIVNSIPTVSFAANTLTGCAPAVISLWNTTANLSQNTTYQWSVNGVPSANQDTMSYTFGPGCYSIALNLSDNGCVGSLDLQNYICVDEPPVAAFTASPSFFSQPTQTISFQNNSSGAQSYVWQTGDGALIYSEDMVHEFIDANQGYTIGLTAISPLGCMDSSFLNLTFQEGIIVYIPNTFTPDGNNFNQQFLPIFSSGIDPNNYTFSIYNRWGELVFQSLNPEVGWDGSFGYLGRDCPQGSYTYKITIKIPSQDNYKVITGHVNLLR